MISVEQAKKILAENSERGQIIEKKLGECLGLILAENIYSPIDVPSFDNSAMDGYAMNFDENSRSWVVSNIIQAGDTSEINIASGKAARIFTGAKIPKGTNTVIPQELIEVIEVDQIKYIGDKISSGSNVRLKGSQSKKNSLILEKGQIFGAGQIGLFASVGVSQVKVFATPKVGFIVTGNELKEPGTPLKDGEIYNSNGPMLEALLKESGVKQIKSYKAPDDKASLQKIIDQALSENDILLLSGGISVGDYDFVKDCLNAAKVEELFYKIKQRPGKPMFAGKKDKKMIFALPGNPASVHSCFIQYVRPSIKHWLGKTAVWEADHKLKITEDIPKKPGFTYFMKGRKVNNSVELLKGQQSFNLQAFATAECLLELPAESSEVTAGTKVKVYDL
ncbi:molybdopterin molybdotransferase MoeA [Salegentibacter salegens]|uniref:Molybdopterin molybdenumtransferase n=1 Tax=Salegentibacter salegens TaxID=143223 RepID=A0A1M7L3P9_9FLAO|nr:gephyrin-like molybdotransferase Glp [Salegentibacter salegens]PRX44828.1 molybdopterin molybdotransferase [Salegentibacter salegens]SHM72372.1 molybdopterin molybdochelatase [Salegentibacter salegens]